MEKTDSEESNQALRNLVLLVGSLSTCGFVELKPNTKADSLYQMPGFTVPQPSGNGQSDVHLLTVWLLLCLSVDTCLHICVQGCELGNFWKFIIILLEISRKFLK